MALGTIGTMIATTVGGALIKKGVSSVIGKPVTSANAIGGSYSSGPEISKSDGFMTPISNTGGGTITSSILGSDRSVQTAKTSSGLQLASANKSGDISSQLMASVQKLMEDEQ